MLLGFLIGVLVGATLVALVTFLLAESREFREKTTVTITLPEHVERVTLDDHTGDGRR